MLVPEKAEIPMPTAPLSITWAVKISPELRTSTESWRLLASSVTCRSWLWMGLMGSFDPLDAVMETEHESRGRKVCREIRDGARGRYYRTYSSAPLALFLRTAYEDTAAAVVLATPNHLHYHHC
jgi:hypothetical protein